jgi:hypothetical protein
MIRHSIQPIVTCVSFSEPARRPGSSPSFQYAADEKVVTVQTLLRQRGRGGRWPPHTRLFGPVCAAKPRKLAQKAIPEGALPRQTTPPERLPSFTPLPFLHC